MMEDVIIKNGFGFKLREDKQKIFAFTVPSASVIDLSPSLLKEQLKYEKCPLYVDDFLLAEFVARFQAKKTDEEFELEIGYAKDASCEIHLSKDKMKASLWLIPSFHGKKITLQDVKNELVQQGVIFGIVSDDILTELVNQEEVDNVIIAEGIEPVNGTDSYIVSLLPVEEKRIPILHDKDDDIVDYRELGDIFLVKDGDLLIEKMPATQGTKGINILGETVAQKEGQDLPLAVDSKSSRLNPENKNQLVAAITGQPVITESGAYVSPIINLDRIDLSTGNVRFDGSIVVANNIESGMTVFSAKDIVVEGDIINSNIECLGDLFVKGNVIGNSQLMVNGKVQIKKGAQGSQETTRLLLSSRIVAMNVVMLGFAENFIVESDSNIVIEQYAFNCNLMAENIEVGTKSKKASIVGGVAWATNLVKTPILGNSSSLPTKICVGLNPRIQTAIEETEILLERNKKKQDNVRNTLAFLDKNETPDNAKKKAQLSFILSELESEANIYSLELSAYKSEMTFIENPKIVIGQKVNLGTTIQIRKLFWKAREVLTKTTFLSEKGEIRLIKFKM